jgi:hypothetical protein
MNSFTALVVLTVCGLIGSGAYAAPLRCQSVLLPQLGNLKKIKAQNSDPRKVVESNVQYFSPEIIKWLESGSAEGKDIFIVSSLEGAKAMNQIKEMIKIVGGIDGGALNLPKEYMAFKDIDGLASLATNLTPMVLSAFIKSEVPIYVEELKPKSAKGKKSPVEISPGLERTFSLFKPDSKGTLPLTIGFKEGLSAMENIAVLEKLNIEILDSKLGDMILVKATGQQFEKIKSRPEVEFIQIQ